MGIERRSGIISRMRSEFEGSFASWNEDVREVLVEILARPARALLQRSFNLLLMLPTCQRQRA